MTSPVERVAEALRLHGDLDTRANADYLAQAVVDALQLTEAAEEQYDDDPMYEAASHRVEMDEGSER